jgi:hypothetical protein
MNARKSVRFEYAISCGRWRAENVDIDREVAALLGAVILNYPRTIPLPASPQHFIARVVLALAEHKLDGGYVHEEFGEDHYCATIVVDKRRDKPKT